MSAPATTRITPARATVASFMGSAVEYYDFFIFGSAAALIFPTVFFGAKDQAALVMSFSTFGFAYTARPVGAVVLGHFGDRIGRQKVLMFTLILMGVSTFIIGCLPTFAQIGWAAPVLLVLCRLTLWLVVVANIVALGTQPMFGILADRIGRKPVFIYGAVSSAVLMPFYMLSMSSGNAVLIFVLAILTFSFGYAAANAVWPSFYGEMFSTRVRFSGMAIGTQLGFLMAGFAPSIVAALGGVQEGGWVVIAAFTAVICLIAAVSALTARETRSVPTAELGLRAEQREALRV